MTATTFRLKSWVALDVSDFLQQFKGCEVADINVCSLLSSNVESVLRSRGVNLKSSIDILRECKRFVRME